MSLQGSSKLEHRVFRVSRNEIHLNVIQVGHSLEHCLAVYYYQNKKWSVTIYAHSLTIDELNLIHSFVPVKGRQYKKEEETKELVYC